MSEEYNWKDYVCDVLMNYETGMKCKDPAADKDSNTSMLCTLIGAARMGLGCRDEKHTNILEAPKIPSQLPVQLSKLPILKKF